MTFLSGCAFSFPALSCGPGGRTLGPAGSARAARERGQHKERGAKTSGAEEEEEVGKKNTGKRKEKETTQREKPTDGLF